METEINNLINRQQNLDTQKETVFSNPLENYTFPLNMETMTIQKEPLIEVSVPVINMHDFKNKFVKFDSDNTIPLMYNDLNIKCNKLVAEIKLTSKTFSPENLKNAKQLLTQINKIKTTLSKDEKNFNKIKINIKTLLQNATDVLKSISESNNKAYQYLLNMKSLLTQKLPTKKEVENITHEFVDFVSSEQIITNILTFKIFSEQMRDNPHVAIS